MGKGQSKLNSNDIKKLTDLTHFSQQELKQWYQGFIKDCPDGILDREKFASMYCQFYDSANADEFSEHVFRTYDTNGDGTIGMRSF